MTVTSKPVSITTPDGVADGYAAYPDDGKRYPAVLFYMDGFGVRPTLVKLAESVAARGYYVLLPNLFYRNGKAPVIDYERVFRGEDRDTIIGEMRQMIGLLTPEAVERDSTAFLAFLDAQPQVLSGAVAATGYCMGGAIALRTAALHPDRVAAAASFHGGNLATEAPTSPHLLADRIKAELYLGHAKDDPSCPAEQVERLEAALDAAGVKHQTEIYEAVHAWTMPDVPWAWNEDAAEKAWTRLYELLGRTLKQA